MSINIQDKLNNLLVSNKIPHNTSISMEEMSSTWNGRGIVMPAGGISILTNAYINIRYIKDFLGSKLPIEVWYLGQKEYYKPIIEDLANRYNDIKFINTFDILEKFPFKNISGWPLKSYAMFHSSFEEIVYLDSDCFIQVKPEKIFEYEIYKEHEALFCSDIEVQNPKRIPYVNNMLGTWIPQQKDWDYTKSNPIWDILGIEEQSGTEIESGLIVINKLKHMQSLLVSRFLNENNDITYNYLYGDKDTYRLAFHKTKTKYNVINQVSRTNDIISGSINYELIYSHRVLTSKFNPDISCEEYPNNLIMNNDDVYKILLKELQKIIGKDKFSHMKYIDIDSIDVSIEYINYFIKQHDIKSILDIGCGNGTYTEYIQIPQDCFYHGIDISPNNIYKCREKFGHYTNYFFSNIEANEYTHYKSYELILIKDLLHHLPFQDIYRILEKTQSSKYIIIINDTPHQSRDIIFSQYRPLDLQSIYANTSIDNFTYQLSNEQNKQCITYYNE